MFNGPEELVVRATLPTRPARFINDPYVSVTTQSCFAGLFNGALSEGSLWGTDGNLFIGKAECECDWQTTWGELKRLGLVEWKLEERPNHRNVGGTTTFLVWHITEKGWEVRNDDDKYFEELLAARSRDEDADHKRRLGSLPQSELSPNPIVSTDKPGHLYYWYVTEEEGFWHSEVGLVRPNRMSVWLRVGAPQVSRADAEAAAIAGARARAKRRE